jgi:hypothetical protein
MTGRQGIDVRTPSLWLRARQWLVAFDEAMHLTEADKLATRIGRLEARVAAMEEAGTRSPEGPVKAQVNQRMGTSGLVAQGPSRLEQKDITFDMSNETGA